MCISSKNLQEIYDSVLFFSYQAPDVQVGLNSVQKPNRHKKQANQTPTREFAAMRMGNKNRKRQKNNRNVPAAGT